MYTFYLHKNIYFIYKICLLIKFAPGTFLPSKTFSQTDLLLPIPICRPWTSLGNTVFMQIVSSYNYERLIRSISTPFCLSNIYTHYLYLYSYSFIRTYISAPFYLSPLFVPPLFFPSISALFTYTLYSYLYSYASILTPSFTTPSLSTSYYSPPLYVHIICTPFSSKIFPKKISTPKAYPKNFPKIFTYLLLP